VPALADKFGVSITPVREAMLDLAKEGLVEPVRNKGFRVRELSAKELDEITDVRLMLEPAAVASLTGKLSAETIQELRALADNIVTTAAAGNVIEYVDADRVFHRTLVELTDNNILTELVMSLRAQSRLFGLHSLAQAGTLHVSAHEHHELIDALQGSDSAAVHAILTHHLGHVRSDWAGQA
jgi:DNA-binding GntR family transcriptional regulator